MKSKLIALLLSGFVFSSLGTLSLTLAQAGQVKVTGELRVAGSGYYSAVDGYFLLHFQDHQLPWGSRVFLRFGFEQSQFVRGSLVPVSSWNLEREIELASSAPFVWSGAVLEQLYARGESAQFTALEFVLRVVYPDGGERFEKGSSSALGFFRVACPAVGAPLQELAIQPIQKP